MEDIFQTFLTATKEELKGAADKLKDMAPPPMNTMLEKESRSSAMKKKIDRSKKITENVPPTTPGISSHILTYTLLVLWFYFSLYMCIKHVLLHTKIIDLFVCVEDLKHNNITFSEKSHICLTLLPLNMVISHNPFLFFMFQYQKFKSQNRETSQGQHPKHLRGVPYADTPWKDTAKFPLVQRIRRNNHSCLHFNYLSKIIT